MILMRQHVYGVAQGNAHYARDAESVSISDIAELVAAALPEEGASK